MDRFPELAYALARLQCVCERVFAADEESLRLLVHLRVRAYAASQQSGFNRETILDLLPTPSPGGMPTTVYDWTAILLAISNPDRTCTLQHSPRADGGPTARDTLHRAISSSHEPESTHPDQLPTAYRELHEALHALNWLKYPLLHPPQPSDNFSEALIVQCILLLDVLERWQGLLARDRARIAALDRAARSLGTIHNHLVRYPLTSTARTAEATGLTPATSLRGLRQLTIMGITEEITGARRNTQFLYRASADILSNASG